MRRVWVVLVQTALLLAAPGAALANVTQPPPPYDPSPLDGDTVYLINQASGLQAEARGADVVETVRRFRRLRQRWAMTKLGSGDWKISNVGTGRCLEAAPARVVVLRACRVGVAAQPWSFSYVGNGHSTIANAQTRRVLGVGHAGKLTQTAVRGSRTQSQLREYRPTYFRGNDSSLQSEAECDRGFANSVPWWHDAYLPGQDLLQIFRTTG